MKELIKTAIVQMNVEADLFEPDCKENNLTKAEQYIADNKDADLIILPDDFYGGYGYGVMNVPDFVMSGTFDKVKGWAREYNVFIAGSSLIPPAKPQGYKSMAQGFLIDPNGEVVARQDRIHLHEREKEWVIPGTEIQCFDTELGKVGFVLGLDVYYPEIARKLAREGVEIIIMLQLCIRYVDGLQETEYSHEYIDLLEAMKTCARARAFENSAYLVCSSALGAYAHADQFQCIGNSLFIEPNGNLQELGSEEGVLRVELKKADLETVRTYFNLLNRSNVETLATS